MSQVSSWLGPPTRNNTMRFPSWTRCASAAAPWVNVNPATPADAAPTRKKSRRDRLERTADSGRDDMACSFAQDRPSSYQAGEAMQADCGGDRRGNRTTPALRPVDSLKLQFRI